jgi:predicted nucleic acid-binding protein
MSRATPQRILIDTGPLVAILKADDFYHQTCIASLREMDQPLYTCWPVLTEAAWLLRHSPRAVERLLAGANGDFLEVLTMAGTEAKAIGVIMKRYESIRPQLADAALVYLADREKIDTIFTLDRRDFSIYRTSRRRAFRLVPEIE